MIAPENNACGHTEVIPQVEKGKSKPAKATKPAKIARPPNAFILYRQHHHPLVKAGNPRLHNNQICGLQLLLYERLSH